jgi:protein-L-isoaspartate O-methyltransferase
MPWKHAGAALGWIVSVASARAELDDRVYAAAPPNQDDSMELVEPLAHRAAITLERLGYGRVHLRTGDGYRGWPEAAQHRQPGRAGPV